MATAKSANKTENKLSFEAGLERLDEIIATLEKDNVPLEDLMKLYEEGVGHLRTCNELLDTAEQKVKMLHISPDGKTARLEPFSEEGEA